MPKNKQQGFSLMEILVTLFIVMVLMIGVYSLVILYLQISNNNKMYVVAIELANQKMEQIRNMPYDDVGVMGGIPSGIIPQEETVERGHRFRVNTYIQFYDDPADGQAGSTTPDAIPNDYKIATVKVSWQSKSGVKTITVFSKIIPRTVETFQGYGLLKIAVRDSYAQPVENASVRFVNNAVTPAIDVVNLTNAQGFLYLPATSSVESYEIIVTKTDEEPAVYWGRDQTYGASSGKAPRHLTVSVGNMTEEEFQIDPLANLRIRTLSTSLPDNFQVNLTKDGRNESRPRPAADGLGNIYFTWQADNATSSLVYVAKYNSAGSRLWASDKTVYASLTQSYPDIAAAAAGDAYLVWQDRSVTLKAITLAPGETRYAQAEIKKNIIKAFFIKSRHSCLIFKNTSLSYLGGLKAEFKTISSLTGNKASSAIKNIFIFSRQAIKYALNITRVNKAEAVGTIIQAIKVSNVVTNNSSVTLSFDSPPTAGNLMIVIAIHENSSQSFTSVTNSAGSFVPSIVSDVAFGLDVGIWHRVAGASEPSAVTVAADGNFEGGVMMLMEVAGIDTANPVNVTAANNQTSSNSRTATTGLTPVSAANGFAVAAIAFADNDFNDPTSANWASPSGDSWTQRRWTEIDGYDDSSLGVATMDVTAAAVQRATLTVTGGGGGEQRNSVMVVYNLYDPDDARVEAGGTQTGSVLRNLANQHLGGYFIISDLTGARNVTSITITENGTIDAQNNLENIKLFYDLDTSAPYDCAGENYSGAENQFGATAAGGFSAADGTVTMDGSVAISTTQTMCVYVVADVGAGAGKNETIEIEISHPASEVTVDNGTVIPQTSVALAGTTQVFVPAEIHQAVYRWRSDSGDEDEAFWLAGQNSGISIQTGEKARLRFRLDNAGSIASSVAYRLEYGQKVTGCSNIGAGSWTALPANDFGDWRSTSSQYYLDGEATTGQLGGGGFVAGEIKKDSNQTFGLSLGGDQSTEIEFALAPTANAGDYVYCFRLTDAGSALDFYDVYAEANIIGDSNIYITRLDSGGNQVWAGVKRVNNNDSAANQIWPRLALTENFGNATTTVVWMDDRNGQYDIYAQSFDTDGNALWNGGDEIPIAASSTNEFEPVVAIDSNDNIIFAWTEDGALDVIYMIKYDLEGNPLWPAPISQSGLFAVGQPALAADDSGNYYLSYTENAGGNLRAYLAKYNGGGTIIWERSVNLDAVSGERYKPVLAVREPDLYAVWTDTRDNKEDIYGQKFDLNGNQVWSRDLLLNITIQASSSTQPTAVVSSTGEPFAAWSDSRNNRIAVYAAEMITPGAVLPVPNVNLHIWGANTISETPQIFEWDLYETTNSSGQLDIRVEADAGGYLVEATSTYSIILIDPPMPLPLLPAQNQIWNIYIE